MVLTDEQKDWLEKLLNGDLDKVQFSNMRSNARRSNNLERSVALAQVFEVYKQEVKNGKKIPRREDVSNQ